MKSKKWLLTAGVVLSTNTLYLVACGKADKEADAPTTFSYVYAVDPASLDYSIATRTSTTDVIGNVVDGLMETTNTEMLSLPWLKIGLCLKMV